jgi:hypothetical protein
MAKRITRVSCRLICRAEKSGGTSSKEDKTTTQENEGQADESMAL